MLPPFLFSLLKLLFQPALEEQFLLADGSLRQLSQVRLAGVSNVAIAATQE